MSSDENWIECPVSGKKWARSHASDLRDCSSCGGKIDTREQAWYDHMDTGATHWPGDCPAQVATSAV